MILRVILFIVFTAVALLTAPANASWPTSHYRELPDSEVIKQLPSFPQTKSQLPTQFSMLIWNIKKGEGKNAWANDFTDLAKQSDVVLLQEAMIDGYMPTVMSSIDPIHFIFAQSFEIVSKGTTTGVSTGAVAEPLAIYFRRSPGREPIVNTPKMTLLTRYELENHQPILVINIHGINFVNNSEFFKQIEDVEETLKDSESNNQRIIFAGDFNTWNKTRLNFLDKATARHGLRRIRFAQDKRLLALDHAYVRGCQSESAQVLSQFESSDHYPLKIAWNCR